MAQITLDSNNHQNILVELKPVLFMAYPGFNMTVLALYFSSDSGPNGLFRFRKNKKNQ